MLDKKYTEAYKSIKAGYALKGKILIQAEENFSKENGVSGLNRRKSTVFAIVACAMLMIGLGVFSIHMSKNEFIEVVYQGKVITENAAEINESSARAVSFGTESVTASGLQLEIRTDSVAKVSVTDGELLIFGENYDDLLFVGTNFTTSEDVLFSWDLSSATETEPSLIIDSDNEHSEYTLQESNEHGCIIMLTVRENRK